MSAWKVSNVVGKECSKAYSCGPYYLRDWCCETNSFFSPTHLKLINLAIKSLLVISEQQDKTKISNRWCINKRLRLNFQKVPKNRRNCGLSSGIRIHVTCRLLQKSHAFHFIRTPYVDKMACFLVPWRLRREVNVRYDASLTGYLVFENNFSNIRASTTIFPKTDTFALASIYIVPIGFLSYYKCISMCFERCWYYFLSILSIRVDKFRQCSYVKL